MQVIVEKAEKSDIPDIDKKKCAEAASDCLKCISAGHMKLNPSLPAQVPRACRPDRGPVRVRHPQADQSQPRESDFYVRQERAAAHRCGVGEQTHSIPLTRCFPVLLRWGTGLDHPSMPPRLQLRSWPTCTRTTRTRTASCTSPTAAKTPSGDGQTVRSASSSQSRRPFARSSLTAVGRAAVQCFAGSYAPTQPHLVLSSHSATHQTRS